MSPRRAAPAALALALLAAGCGDGALWARWSAERGAWRAQRALERIESAPSYAQPEDWRRAEVACDAVTRRFPAAAWGAAARARARCAGEVLAASGRAALLRARLAELRGHPAGALDRYAALLADYAAAPRVVLAGAVARARLLERLGRAADAEEAWLAVARSGSPDPDDAEELADVLEAPLRVAAVRRARGAPAGVDSILSVAEASYSRLLASRRGQPDEPGLWARLGAVRAALGDGAGARVALRAGLAQAVSDSVAAPLVLDLARRSLEAGLPDTARAYARWAAARFEGTPRAEGLLLAARSWRLAGRVDSALGGYEQVLDTPAEDAGPSLEARYERARLLEGAGRWDEARAEYHALAGVAPAHALACEARLRLVRHPLEHGDRAYGLIEARHALQALAGLAETEQDEEAQLRIGQTRARLMLETGDRRGACGALAALLRRYPEAPLDGGLLLLAAGVAETSLDDTDLAMELYRAAAVRAPSPEARRRARDAAGRLSALR